MKIKLAVRAHPNAKKRKAAISERGLEIWLQSVADKGKANKELCEQLAGCLKLPKSAVTLSRGQTSRNKTVEVDLTANGHEGTTLNQAELMQRISECFGR